MADYWTNFSFMVLRDSVGEEVIADIRVTLDALSELYLDTAVDGHLRDLKVPEYMIEQDVLSIARDDGFGICVEMEAEDLWLGDDGGHPNMELLNKVIQAALEHHSSNAVVAYDWGNNCSKPRCDGFGGGAVVISRNDTRGMTTYWWMRDTAAKMAVELTDKPAEVKKIKTRYTEEQIAYALAGLITGAEAYDNGPSAYGVDRDGIPCAVPLDEGDMAESDEWVSLCTTGDSSDCFIGNLKMIQHLLITTDRIEYAPEQEKSGHY